MSFVTKKNTDCDGSQQHNKAKNTNLLDRRRLQQKLQN